MKNNLSVIKPIITKDELQIILALNPDELFLGFICVNKCAIPENYEIRTDFIDNNNIKNFKKLNDTQRIKKLKAMRNLYYEIYFKDKLN